MSESRLEVIVAARRDDAQDIAVLELVSLGGAELPAFDAGAHINVEVGPGLTRQYSLCNSPAERKRYEIGILREPASRGGSIFMHGLKIGNRLRISPPLNHFPLATIAGKTLLLAGGIGITPLLAMAEHMNLYGRPFELHYGARTRSRMAFYERVQASPFAGKVHLHIDDGPSEQQFDIPKALRNLGKSGQVYVCGPSKFIQCVREFAKDEGIDDAHVHFEYFAAAQSAQAEGNVFQIKIASSGQVIDIPANRSVVQVLHDHGIEIPVSCEQGVCGTCLTRVLQGVPDHRDYFLTPEEQKLGDQFTPCCSRSRSQMLVLDL